MLDSVTIVQLFENVLNNDMLRYNISVESIKEGIECMAHVYKAHTGNLSLERSMIADYTDVAHRCAYLHKYAAFHTAMVRDMLQTAIEIHYGFFYKLIFSGDRFRICSLGGGPGSDVIGALAALHAAFSYFDTSVTVVDYMVDWSFSFDSILRELGSGWYGAFGSNTSYYLNWQYVGANLLKSFKPEVVDALSSASLVTMIKFTSAAACQDTKSMIKNIFAAMKPGAAVLFIDNDGGGFHELMMDAADEFNFISIFGPLRRENYTNDLMRVKRFGYVSCFKTTVTVHILQKPFPITPYDNFPSVYDSSCIGNQNRTVLLQSPFVPDSPSIGNQNRTVLLQSPFVSRRPTLLGSPLTPMLYRGPCDFTHDENISSRDFSSPVSEIPQTPYHFMPSRVVTPISNDIINSPLSFENMRPPNSTPNSQRRRKKRSKNRKQGCFPFKINNFRHHLSRKVNQVKSHARAMFEKRIKNGKAHPIFRL